MNVWQKQARRNEVYSRGVPVEAPGFDGWKFFIRPLNAYNVHWKRAAARIAAFEPETLAYLERAKSPEYQPTPEDQELDDRMMRHGFADGCISSWEGVTNEAGEPMAYSAEAAREIVNFFPPLYAYLDAFARDVRNFPALTADDKEAVALGNLPPASLTSSELGGNTPGTLQPATAGGKTRRPKS